MGCGTFIFAKKITSLRGYLWHWSKLNFGSVKLKKMALLQEVEMLDIAKESCGLTLVETRQELALFKNLGKICK